MSSYTNIVEEVVRNYYASRLQQGDLPTEFVTNIPAVAAHKLIGSVNPGVGYWWTHVEGQWYLCVPAGETVNLFWPVFIVTAVVFHLLVWLWERRGSKLSGAN